LSESAGINSPLHQQHELINHYKYKNASFNFVNFGICDVPV